MAKASENLARSLEELHQLQERGQVAIKSTELSKTHRERLIKNGFLKKVINGWYLPTSPDEKPGDTTSWYASYWNFCSQYLTKKFGKSYCLSADHSIQLHSGNMSVPFQLIVRSNLASKRSLLGYSVETTWDFYDYSYIKPCHLYYIYKPGGRIRISP